MNSPVLRAHLLAIAALLMLSACSETERAPNTPGDAAADASGTGDSASDAAGDTTDGSADSASLDTASGSADTAVEPTCTPVAAGNWNVNGSCIGMMMSGELSLDASGCTFTLGNWNMAMDVPGGGAVEGDTVTFTGRNWTGCTGTVAATGRRIDASCPAAAGSPACTFTMVAR